MNLLVMGASSDIAVEAIGRISDNYECIVAHYCHMNDKLSGLKEKLKDKLVLIQADLMVESDVLRLVDEVKAKNILISHILHFPAPKIQIQKFNKMKWSDFEDDINVSLKSLVLVLEAFIPQMVKAKSGKIVVMLSWAVTGMPPKYSSDYVTVKYALLGLVKALAVEYAEKGITVNGISPGFVETKFVDGMMDFFVEENRKASPIGRNLNEMDIVPTIEFLLSAGADCINGQNIPVTCGR